ncbi:MAG: hypothetical protein L3J87_00960 [Thermoplasmata archaeon]|nr:hypothetical protein [Thermoplasmata archaeon]
MVVPRPTGRARRLLFGVLFGAFRVEWTAAVLSLALAPLPLLAETFYFARVPPGVAPFAVIALVLGVAGWLAYYAVQLPGSIPRSWARTSVPAATTAAVAGRRQPRLVP